MKSETKRAWLVRIGMATVAVVFGFLTLKSGGSVLFGSEEARQAAGDYVPFVVWFNFVAGFGYVLAGVGLWRRWAWIRWLASLIAVGSAITYFIFGIHVLRGGAYETRTVVAMAVRTGVWFIIAIATFYMFGPEES